MAGVKHKIPKSEKNRSWRIEAIRENAERSMNSFHNASDLRMLKMCAGELESTDYTYVTNPLSLKEEKYQKYPAKLINMDIIGPLFKRLLAQFTERFNEPIVYTKNSNFDSRVSAYETGLIKEALQQEFINELINAGTFDPLLAQEQQQEEPMSPEVIRQKKSSIKDLVTIEGQHVMNYVIDSQMLPMKYRKAWEMFIKLNKCVTYKTVQNDEVVVKNVSSLDFEWYGNPLTTTFIEDAEAVRANYYVTFEEVLEIFQSIFEEEEYKKEYGDISEALESNSNVGHGMKSNLIMGDFISIYNKNQGIETAKGRGVINDITTCKVTHVQFTSFRKVGKIYDVEANKVIEVDEDYLGDDVYEWMWYPEEREGWVINDEYYLGGYECDVQLVDPDNPFYTKKGYNGRMFMSGEVRQKTIPEMLAHFQEAYNVVKWKTQVTINKNKDKLLIMPIGLLGHMKSKTTSGKTYYNGDLDEDGKLAATHNPSLDRSEADSGIAKSLYYADATQMLFVDETSEGAALAVNMIKSVDLSLGNYIEYLLKFAATIKAEAEEYVGFNRFMMAKTTTNDPVGNVQQGVYSGSMVLEELFTEFEEYLQTEYQGIINRGKFAYKEGRKAGYVRSNTDFQTMQITGNFANHVYGVFVRSGAKTKELRDNLRAHTNEMLQNGMPASAVAKMEVSAMNYVEIIQVLEEAEEKVMNEQREQNAANNEAMLEAKRLDDESKDKDREIKIYDIDMRAQTAMLDSLREAQSFLGSAEDPKGLETINKSVLAITSEMNKTRANFADIKAKLKMNADNNDTKRYVADSAKSVAKINK